MSKCVTVSTASTAVGSGSNPTYVNSSGVATASSTTVGTYKLPVYMNAGVLTACDEGWYGGSTQSKGLSMFYRHHGFVFAKLNGETYSQLEIEGCTLESGFRPQGTLRIPGIIIESDKVYIAVLKITSDGVVDGTYWTSYPGTTQPSITSGCKLYFNVIFSAH